MNKELYVSATPHETKVGITEDDQLAEIYLEQENEYTLAGSIYKGRVTRVLPGMQSAFVDIGLERDAFLYVSDFMELETQDEDLDEAIPTNRPVTEPRPRHVLEASGPAMQSDGQPAEAGSATGEAEEPEAASSDAPGNAAGAGTARDFRGRRRRRGRRGEIGRGPGAERGERSERSETPSEPHRETSNEIRNEAHHEPRQESRGEPRHDRFSRGERPGRGGTDSRFQRSAPPAARVGRDYDYGPPPGYQPIILPGESISKYQRQGQAPGLSSEQDPDLELDPGQLCPWRVLRRTGSLLRRRHLPLQTFPKTSLSLRQRSQRRFMNRMSMWCTPKWKKKCMSPLPAQCRK